MVSPLHTIRFRLWREIAIFSLIGMEMCWVALWFRLITQTGDYVSFERIFIVLGGTLLGVYILAFLLNEFRVRDALRRSLMGVLLIVSIFVCLGSLLYTNQQLSLWEVVGRPFYVFNNPGMAVAAEFLTIVIVLWVWWRGVTLVGGSINPAVVIRSQKIGVAMLLIYGFIAPFAGEIPVAACFLFLLFWLLAMGAARMYTLGLMDGSAKLPFNSKWLAWNITTSVALIGLSLLAVSLMQWKGSTLILEVLTWVFRAIFLVGSFLALPILLLLMATLPFLADWLKMPLNALVEVIGEYLDFLTVLVQRLQDFVDGLFSGLTSGLGERLVKVRPFVLWGILLCGIILVLWSIRHRFHRETPGSDLLQESSIEANGFLDGIYKALRNSARSMIDFIAQLVDFRRVRQAHSAARIRKIYRMLLDLAEKLGKPRPSAWTPLEYLPTLQWVFPDHTRELNVITEAYLKVRYGEFNESEADVKIVEIAWELVDAEGQERLKIQSQA